MDGNKNVIANFSKITYILTLTANGAGTTDPVVGGHTYDVGTVVTITATAASGWKFDGWSGDSYGNNTMLSIRMDGAKSVVAHFSRITHQLTLSTNGNGTTYPLAGVSTYDEGLLAYITANPASGWKFDGWSGDSLSTDATATIRMDGNKNITANFSKITYILTLTANGAGTTDPVVGGHTYDVGTVVSITASPGNGWKFDGWSGDSSSTDATATIRMEGNKNVIANFSKVTYILTLTANGTGTTDPPIGGHTYDAGTVVTVTARPASGWSFGGWTGDVNTASATAAVAMSSNKSITANFLRTSSLVQQSQIPVPAPISTQLVSRKYEWSYGDSTWTWEPQFPQAFYDYFKALPRSPTDDYSVYVTNPNDDILIKALADKIRQASQEEGYDDYETVTLAVSFVQNLAYTSDLVTTGYDEYPRYPIETLVDNGGDCEDTSILMAAILDQMRYGVILINPPNHMAVGVLGGEGMYGTYWELNGDKYYYLETTGEGYQIGELPSEYRDVKAQLYEMIPVPILTHEWKQVRSYSSFAQWYYEIEVRVENQGTATANGLHVTIAFDAGSNMVWNRTDSSSFNLDPGYRETITMHVKIPRDEYTRLIVTVVQDGFAILRSYSDWYQTS